MDLFRIAQCTDGLLHLPSQCLRDGKPAILFKTWVIRWVNRLVWCSEKQTSLIAFWMNGNNFNVKIWNQLKPQMRISLASPKKIYYNLSTKIQFTNQQRLWETNQSVGCWSQAHQSRPVLKQVANSLVLWNGTINRIFVLEFITMDYLTNVWACRLYYPGVTCSVISS